MALSIDRGDCVDSRAGEITLRTYGVQWRRVLSCDPATMTWYVDMDNVRAMIHAGQVLKPGAREVTMFVELGTGQSVVTRRTIRI